MTAWRRLIRRHRRLAGWLVLLALAVKLAVPAGFMLGNSADGSVVLELCSGFGPVQLGMAMPGMDHHQDKSDQHDKQVCPFAGLSLPSLAGADPLVLAIAIAFIAAFALHFADTPRVVRFAYLRPPLRGPPAR